MSQDGLAGKVALVTGAAKRGMGRAVALRLARKGADVAVLDLSMAPRSLFEGDEGWWGLDEVVEVIEALGRGGLALMADISNQEQTAEAVAAVATKFGKIDILVNCAGMRGTPNVDVVDGGEGGKIVLIASLAGREGVKGNAAYAASKWGVIGLVQSLAKETASHRINVNAICPGMIITNLRDHWIEAAAKQAGTTSGEYRKTEYERGGKAVPLGRMGTPEDIANVVSFLASDQSAYMTGQSFNVCGGLVMN